MNEPILKLAVQAGMYVDLAGKPWPKWMSAEECEVAYAKFAELIVKECADQIRYCQANDIDFVAKNIEKHFGIE